MAGHADILDERESLRRPLAGSVLLHVAVFSSLVLYTWVDSRGREQFGSPNAGGGGSVMVTPVNRINIPSRGGVVNPVANDTESLVPAPPPKPVAQQRQPPPPEPDAIPVKTKRLPRKQSEVAASRQQYRSKREEQKGQLYSQSGQAASSSMFDTVGGGGSIGGPGGSLGTRFGWYDQLLREKIASAWKTADVDARLQTAPPVIVTFDILRDGSVRNVRLLQRSGNYQLDMSAQRAILEAAPFQPLPPGFERNVAAVEIWFQLKR